MIDKPRLSPKQRKDKRSQALLRYEKHRKLNKLALPGCHQMILILDNLKGVFNVPKIFRSAEVLGVQEIHLINIPPFDPAPAKGGFKKVPAYFHDDFDSCYQQLTEKGYTIFTLEPKCKNLLHRDDLPAKSAFILGHEEFGISFDPTPYSLKCLKIPQFGQTQSLNVSIAASIVMYEYIRQHA